MVTIKNQVRKIQVDTSTIKKKIGHILTLLGYQDFAIGIWLTTNVTLRRYNKKYRNKDNPTDVLSFPYHPNCSPGNRIEVQQPEDKNLGDILISLEYVAADAPRWHHTFAQHLDMIIVHGICHLLGYDHQTDDDYEVMHRLEKKLLKSMNTLFLNSI